MIQNILITGGAGNLGRVCAAELGDTYHITLFDRVTPQKARIPWETEVPFVLGDLTDFGDCMRAISLAQADAILHLGALAGPTELTPWRKQQRMPEDETMRVNTMGTYYLMDAARRLGVKKVAFASTYYVLGLGFKISDKPFQVEYLPIDEKHPCRPESTYGLSKLIGEEILAAFQRAYGIQTAAFRLMGVEYAHRPVHKTNITPEAKPGHVGGPIGTTWQYSEARDIALAMQLFLEADDLGQFEAFYHSTDTATAEDTRDLVERLYPDLKEMAANLAGTEGIISIKKLQDMLGYEPQRSWRNQDTP
jgi:nucleoside-diphosphate-sugar epimerase